MLCSGEVFSSALRSNRSWSIGVGLEVAGRLMLRSRGAFTSVL